MQNQKITVGIVGGAGYTAGELVRLLLHHPHAEIGAVVSSTQAGQPIHTVHEDLLGDTDILLASELQGDEDVVFLCLGHGHSREWLLKSNLPASTKVIDLSNDFRLGADRDVAGRHFVYGLPEANREQIRTADSIANPGCFASAIRLALLPLAAAGQLTDAVHVSAITGSTGAGRGLVETTGYTWRTGNISTYKTFTHQHPGEIGETLVDLQPAFNQPIRFIPYRGNFTRGIFASVYTTYELLIPEVQKLCSDYYRDAPFTIVSGKEIHLKQVVNTNKCLVHVAKHDDQVLITTALDNLLKGASGQAIQNMNLLFGFEETAGLGTKASFFKLICHAELAEASWHIQQFSYQIMGEEYAAMSRVVNSEILFDHFGYWPNFHDAEVMKVTFEALPTWRAAVTFTINTFEMTSKVNEKGYFDPTNKCQIEVQLTGIKHLDFNYFSHQNVLFEFWFEEHGSDIKAVFSSSVGMEATVVAEEALILSLTPIEKLQVDDVDGYEARGSAQPV